jgi:hypothetical protein
MNLSLYTRLHLPAASLSLLLLGSAVADVSDEELRSIQTPSSIQTSIGELKFFDGVPARETAAKAYDFLDLMRGVDTFLKGMPIASVNQLIDGPKSIGATDYHHVLITEELMDSKPLFLTANTSTLYVTPILDVGKNGPMVVEVPPGMLGAFNDAAFRYMADIGPFGPDKGKGGKFLVVPASYEGELPDGYFVVKSRTNRVWTFMRGSIANGLSAAVENIKANLKIYPLAAKDDPVPMEFINGSGKSFNTIHSNDYSFYEHLAHVVQHETSELLDPETRGLFASIGIERDKPFQPDERMQKILTEAVAIANATARSIVWYPRYEMNMKGIRLYPDTNSAWIYGWVNKDVFFLGEHEDTMNSDARVMFHYPYTAVTPAMATTIPGKGSDYGIAFLDGEKQVLDGAKNYQVKIPANAPAADFWALTVYDTQTRSQLQTSQPFPTVGSQTEGIRANEDGSHTIFFGPQPPPGFENNWLETIPGKSWFVALRMYGPEQAWIDKSWRPSEVELID